MRIHADLESAAEEAVIALSEYAENALGRKNYRPYVFSLMFATVRNAGWSGTAISEILGGPIGGFDTAEYNRAKKAAADIEPSREWRRNDFPQSVTNAGLLFMRLLREHSPEIDDGWPEQEIDLSDLSDDTGITFLTTPTLGSELFYAEAVWTLSGHKGSGKSMAMMKIGLDHAAAGGHVVYLDMENGSKRFKRRLRQLGADPTVCSDRLHYLSFPKGLSLETLYGRLRQAVEDYGNVLLIVDSFRGLFGQLNGGTENLTYNDPVSIERVMAPLTQAVAGRGLTVALIDHTTKSGSENDEYSTGGSGAKENAVDAVYFWTKLRDFSATESGTVRIKPTKDRDGELFNYAQWATGGQGKGKPQQWKRMSDAEVSGDLKLLGAVRSFLEQRPDEYFTLSAVRSQVKGDDKKISAALKALVGEEGMLGFFHESNPATESRHPEYVFSPGRASV